MRYALLLSGALSLTCCASERAAQRIPKPHTCNWYKPVPHGEGVTELAFVVDARGYLQDITAAKSSGSDEIDRGSIGCATHWHYFPASADGKHIEQRWGARIDWRGNAVSVTELAPAP